MNRVGSYVFSAICVIVTFSSPSRADSSSITRANAPDGYGYRFTDDPLSAGLFGANDARIQVATHVVRATLIRPRTAFVTELLKTVENL